MDAVDLVKGVTSRLVRVGLVVSALFKVITERERRRRVWERKREQAQLLEKMNRTPQIAGMVGQLVSQPSSTDTPASSMQDSAQQSASTQKEVLFKKNTSAIGITVMKGECIDFDFFGETYLPESPSGLRGAGPSSVTPKPELKKCSERHACMLGGAAASEASKMATLFVAIGAAGSMADLYFGQEAETGLDKQMRKNNGIVAVTDAELVKDDVYKAMQMVRSADGLEVELERWQRRQTLQSSWKDSSLDLSRRGTLYRARVKDTDRFIYFHTDEVDSKIEQWVDTGALATPYKYAFTGRAVVGTQGDAPCLDPLKPIKITQTEDSVITVLQGEVYHACTASDRAELQEGDVLNPLVPT